MRTLSEPLQPPPQSDPYMRLACMVIGSAVKNYFGIGTADIPHARKDAELFLFGDGPIHGRETTAEEDCLVAANDGEMVPVKAGEKYYAEPFFPTHEARRAHWFHQAGMAVPNREVLLKDIHRWKSGMDGKKART